MSELKLLKGITVRTAFEGYHHWPEAPEEVKFLRYLHRHKFHVEAQFAITDSNRELEFFLTQRKVANAVLVLREELTLKPTMSCEMMAENILRRLRNWNLPAIKVLVSEDGENDGFVELYQ